eukprot:COSAG05_NODE_782_length_7373_cov_4.015122_4_plen_89_part_00
MKEAKQVQQMLAAELALGMKLTSLANLAWAKDTPDDLAVLTALEESIAKAASLKVDSGLLAEAKRVRISFTSFVCRRLGFVRVRGVVS